MALKRIKNVHRTGAAREFQYPPGRWVTVEHGATVDVPAELADSLTEQDGWQAVNSKAAAAAEEV